ncbi:MAG: energy transducer TonB [Stagnimonas sp.]|nr:energy transducer TonB [Stagnimonas sp.]
MGRPQRGLAGLLIVGLHVGALAALMHLPAESAPLPAPQAMMVSFISEPAPPKVEPPPPEPPPPPKPLPKLVASSKPTPSVMQAPPPDELPAVEETAAELPPAPPQPPAPAPEPEPEPVIVPPNFVAAYLNNPGPAYPYVSKRQREQGEVMLRVLVSAAGRAEQVLIERSSGHSRLDEAAQEVVLKRWRFVAAKKGDQAISAWVLVPIQFELKG